MMKLFIEAWCSLVARLVRDQEVMGSNPIASTIENRTWGGETSGFFVFSLGSRQKRRKSLPILIRISWFFLFSSVLTSFLGDGDAAIAEDD